MTGSAIDSTLTQGEAAMLRRSPLSTLADAHATVDLHLPGGAIVPGWMSRRFGGGQPTYWIMTDAGARCVEPTGWSRRP